MTQMKLLKSRRFAPLFWTQFLGAFNDNLLKNSLIILITFHQSSEFGLPANQMVVLAGGVFILPFFLFSAMAGQLADKFEKAHLIHWIKLAEIFIMFLASIGFIQGRPALLFFTLFLMGLHSTFFGPIKYSLLPQHLAQDELVGGNALVEAGTFLAILLGTITGGLLISQPQGRWVVSGGLMGIAILGWITSQLIPPAQPVDPLISVDWNPVRPTVEVYRFCKKSRTLYFSILGISWFWFFGAAILSLFPSYGKDVLHADERVVTLFLTTFSIGIAIGSLLCERLSRNHLELGLVPFGSFGVSLFFLDLFLASHSVRWSWGSFSSFRILFDLLALSVFSGFYIVPLYTLIQERTEASHQSRVIAANNIINAFFMVGSALWIAFLLKIKFSIPEIFLSLGVLNVGVALLIYSWIPEFLLRFIAWIFAHLLYRLKVEGGDQIPRDGGVILVCNHVSFVDWLVIAAAVQRPARFIMDYGFARGRFIQILLRQAKVILIATVKEDPKLLFSAFEKAAAELRAGQVVCIFPEGKLTQDGEMNPFKSGVEKMVRDTPVPVIPMALRGLWGSFFSRKGGRAIFKKPSRFWSRVELKIGAPIPPSEVTSQLLFERVRALRGDLK